MITEFPVSLGGEATMYVTQYIINSLDIHLGEF